MTNREKASDLSNSLRARSLKFRHGLAILGLTAGFAATTEILRAWTGIAPSGAWLLLVSVPFFSLAGFVTYRHLRLMAELKSGCPHCGYSRQGLSARTPCPECGSLPDSGPIK